MKIYVLFEKAYYTDGLGADIAASKSKAKLIKKFKSLYPKSLVRPYNKLYEEIYIEDDDSQTFGTIIKTDMI